MDTKLDLYELKRQKQKQCHLDMMNFILAYFVGYCRGSGKTEMELDDREASVIKAHNQFDDDLLVKYKKLKLDDEYGLVVETMQRYDEYSASWTEEEVVLEYMPDDELEEFMKWL